MELSDNFRFVIEEMPCCQEDNPDIEDYIKEFVFDYFGFTYVTQILLGGIAQQNILMNRTSQEQLEKKGLVVTHEAKVTFDRATNASLSASVGTTNSATNSNYTSFMKEVLSMHITTLGGVPHLHSFSEWASTVAANPVIVEFTLRDIFRLLTKQHFPNDPLIKNKSKLIEQALTKYLDASPYCFDKCGGDDEHGACEPTGYFQFGICKCKPEWTGYNCQKVAEPEILLGTICGLNYRHLSLNVNCGGLRPKDQGCPTGWGQYEWSPTELTTCYKEKSERGAPVVGTLCGLYSEYHAMKQNINCNMNVNTKTGTCPSNYHKFFEAYQPTAWESSVYIIGGAVCASLNAKEDLPGTLCGMQIEHTIDGPSCNHYNPGLRQCPVGYSVQATSFKMVIYLVCVKL
ncbi:unnamed protein product [Rotaria magnacalcarata]|uniref:EGF-like domain-containing protein n=1 Tax=Rotaria magnacalcarata TaxID=392030 RepID=A0A815NLK6_9BILA|nr:unnamed protein product [Rotaria magnacalcarata]CAF1611629.1 unnamed protein product [Rotaria magnacalcarata]CAF2065123.1 unnamed protein product [Rotaria magnacalcarata]CAF3787609.1 unnamed protein product [Rotaria magnacalcarata]CAF3805067.1 unnamed protein product [Rotaria magnacalcarata]